MALTSLTTIKNWFKTNLIPTQQQFYDMLDSFRHKNDKVAATDIDGLTTLLAAKASQTDFNSHATADNAHAGLFGALRTWVNEQIAGFVVGSTLIDGVTLTSVLPETGNIHTIVAAPGTYVNWNNTVVPANTIAILKRFNGGFSSSMTAFDVSGKINVSDVINNLTSTETNKPGSANNDRLLDLKIADGVPEWTNKPFLEKNEVSYLGKFWRANANTLSTDIPGTSSKWTDMLTGYFNASNKILPNQITGSTAEINEIFTTVNATAGSYVSNLGVLIALGGTNVTDFISIDLIDSFEIKTVNNFALKYALYTSDKTFISIKSAPNGQFIETGVFPVAAKFIRINYHLTDAPSLKVTKRGGISWLKFTKTEIEGYSKFTPKSIIPADTIWGNVGFYLANNVSLAFGGVGGYSDFIRINPNTNYSLFINTNYQELLSYYDGNKNPIGRLSTGGTVVFPGYFPFTSPANAYFVRINKFKTTEDTGLFLPESIAFKDNYTLDWLPIAQNSGYSLVPLPSNSTNTLSFTTRDRNTFVGAMNYVLDKLFLAKPSARIAIVTHYTNDGGGKNAIRKLVNVQKGLAQYWNCKLINVADNLNWINRDGNDIVGKRIMNGAVREGVHPAYDYNATTGRSANIDMIAAFCAEELRGMFLDWTGKKVAWYGTSIPDGAPYEAIDNCNYPILAVNKLGGVCQNYSRSASTVRIARYNGTLIDAGRSQFSNDNQPGYTTYVNSMIPLIGTANEPDLFVFDFGYNDLDTDFDIMNYESAI